MCSSFCWACYPEGIVVFSELLFFSRNRHSSFGIVVLLSELSISSWNRRSSFGIVVLLSESLFFFWNRHSSFWAFTPKLAAFLEISSPSFPSGSVLGYLLSPTATVIPLLWHCLTPLHNVPLHNVPLHIAVFLHYTIPLLHHLALATHFYFHRCVFLFFLFLLLFFVLHSLIFSHTSYFSYLTLHKMWRHD